MQIPSSTLLLVGIKQEGEFSNPDTVLERHKHGRRRLHAEQDSSGSSENDCASSKDEWKPSLAMSSSPAESNNNILVSTIPSTVPTGDLNTATCLSISKKTSDPKRMHYSRLEEPTGEEPTRQLEADHSLRIRLQFHDNLKRGVIAVREYNCEFCGKAFPKISKLDQHVNGVHKNLRKFPCDICGFSFKYNENLKSHVNGVHKNLRKFPCDICGHSFKVNEHLKRHINNVHRNLRNFLCNICDHSFKEKGALKSHVNYVHKNLRNLPCNICGHFFRQNRDLNRHINTVHKKLRPFLCAVCGRAFTANSSLKKHLLHFHPEVKPEEPENLS